MKESPEPPFDGAEATSKEEANSDPKTTQTQSVQKLERILAEALGTAPEPERKEIVREFVREFMGMIVHSKTSSPFDIDPKIAEILAEAQTKDSQNKFEFARQRQKDNHEFRMIEHRDRYKVVGPLVFIVAAVTAACLFIGIWLSYVGHTNLGGCLITGVITAVLGYLAGAGTAEWFKAHK